MNPGRAESPLRGIAVAAVMVLLLFLSYQAGRRAVQEELLVEQIGLAKSLAQRLADHEARARRLVEQLQEEHSPGTARLQAQAQERTGATQVPGL